MTHKTMRQAMAIRHVHFEDLGSFQPILLSSGYQIEYVDAGSDNLEQIDPFEPDLLLILGGPISAYEEIFYPFLTDEIRLIERRLTRGLPTLGICLGSQLMARALGASVYRGEKKEIGWSPLTITPEGYRSCLHHLADEDTAVLHWHGDTFDLPQGATRLASTDICKNQAFSWGSAALALQFHAEVEPRQLERWYIGHACELANTPSVSLQMLRDQARIHGTPLVAAAGRMLQHWLGNFPQQNRGIA